MYLKLKNNAFQFDILFLLVRIVFNHNHQFWTVFPENELRSNMQTWAEFLQKHAWGWNAQFVNHTGSSGCNNEKIFLSKYISHKYFSS